MPSEPRLVAADPFLETLAGAISALISVRRDAMGLETHALPQMDRAIGPKVPVLLLDAHMPFGFAPDELLDGVHNTLLDVSAQRVSDIQILSGNLYRHRPREDFRKPLYTALPRILPLFPGADLALAHNA
jgi:hypothetical protein